MKLPSSKEFRRMKLEYDALMPRRRPDRFMAAVCFFCGPICGWLGLGIFIGAQIEDGARSIVLHISSAVSAIAAFWLIRNGYREFFGVEN
jgi:hypothetical protein